MSPTNAQKLERLLQQAVEERQSVDRPELCELAALSPGLQHELELQHQLDLATQQWKAATPSCDLTDIIIARHRWALDTEARATTGSDGGPAASRPRLVSIAGDSRPTTSPRYAIAALITSAAAMLLVVLAAGRVQPDAGPAETAVALVEPATLADIELETIIRPAGSVYRTFVEDAGKAVSDATALVARPTSELPTESDSTIEESLRRQTSVLVDRWSDDLRPLSEDVGRAFDFIIKTVPTSSVPAT